MRKIFGILVACLLNATFMMPLNAQNNWNQYQQRTKEAEDYLKRAPKGTVLTCTASDPASVSKGPNAMYQCERSGMDDMFGNGKLVPMSLNSILKNGWDIKSQTKEPVELMNGNISYKLALILKKK